MYIRVHVHTHTVCKSMHYIVHSYTMYIGIWLYNCVNVSRLYLQQSGREVKILLSQDTITSAQKLVQEKQVSRSLLHL